MTGPLHIGNLEIGRVPRVVGTISSPGILKDVPGLLTQVSSSCDLVEFRVDLLGDYPWREALRQVRDVAPCLLTIRSREEGGAWKGTASERLDAYLEILPLADALDVELESSLVSTLAKQTASANIPLVVSHHNFEQTPNVETLKNLIQQMEELGSHVVAKLAVTLVDEDDIGRLEEVLQGAWKVPVCLLGMGSFAEESRIRLVRQGSALTYGYLDQAVAPGQPAAGDLKRLLS